MRLTDVQHVLATFLASGVQPIAHGGGEFLLTPFSYPNGEVLALSVEETSAGCRITDVGSTDGFLAERGVTWSNVTVRRAIDAICQSRGVRVDRGLIVKECSAETLAGAVMDVVQAAQAVAGVAYAPRPRMPQLEVQRTRARVRTKLSSLLQIARPRDSFEPYVVLRGKSEHEIVVTRVRDRPIVIFSESLRAEPVRRAEATAFEWIDAKSNGLPRDYRAACVYDPPDALDGRLAEAEQILRSYFEEGVFSLAEPRLIIGAARIWAPEPPSTSRDQLEVVQNTER
jgi:hypothetical protein